METGGKALPLEPRPDELVLIREPGADLVLVIFPSGDSYFAGAAELMRFLERLGCPFPDKVVDFVWNFYGTWVGCISWEYQRVSRSDAYRAALGKKVEHGTEIETAGIA